MSQPKRTFVVYDRTTKKAKSIRVPAAVPDDGVHLYIADYRKEWKEKQATDSSCDKPLDSTTNRPGPEGTHLQVQGTDLHAPTTDKVVPATDKLFAGLTVLGPFKPDVSLNISKKTGTTYLCLGSSKRGKSSLMIHLWKKYYNEKEIISTLFSGNPHIKIYKSAGAKLLTTYGFNEQHTKYIMMQHFINCKTNNQYRFMNLFDDIITAKRSPCVEKLILTYRNANISMFICLQYQYLFSKMCRANVNHTFIFGMNSVEDIKGVLDVTLGPYLTDLGIIGTDKQIAFFRECTKDHGFFHLDNITGELSRHRLAL